MQSAASLISAMKASLARQKSVHLVITARDTSPKQTETIIQDSGPNSGSQNASSGGAYARILLTPTFAYFSGDSAGLTEFFSMPSDDLGLVGQKWVSVASGSSQYSSFATSITMEKLRTALVPTVSSITVSNGKVNSRAVNILKWSSTSSGQTTTLTLTMDATGSSLPLFEVGKGGTVTQTSTFSHWNEAVHITAPKSIIALSKLKTT